MTAIDPRIFRAYDIRGRANEQLTEDACRMIGRAFGSELRDRTGKQTPTVCVGRDARTHGPAFEAAVTEGLLASGCNVALIGQTPSPVNYFTICTAQLDGGVQVTASHNPAHDNGLKLSIADAEAFAENDLQRLRQRIDEKNFSDGSGETQSFDAVTPYKAFLETLFANAGDGLTIAVDSGNGVAGPVYCDVLAQAGADVTGLYIEPDGTFPHHLADPSKHETLKDLQLMMRERNAAIGFAFDGDGDRLGVVDETGTIRTADDILLLLARDHLSRFQNAPVVFTVSNSGILQSEIASWGGRPVMCKVGHSFVEHAMREHNALLGGEQSGHFFCGEEYFGFDDALVAALRVCSIAKNAGVPFSALFADFPKVFQAPERRPTVPDDRKLHVVRQVVDFFSKDHPVETMDGARIDFGDGSWAGIRASNTSPSISICIEARSPERLAQIEEMVLGHLKTYEEIEWQE